MVKYTCKGQSRFQYYQYVTRFLTNTSHYRIFNFFFVIIIRDWSQIKSEQVKILCKFIPIESPNICLYQSCMKLLSAQN